MNWWVSQYYAVHPVLLYSWVIWVVGSITLHELGHGFMAIRCGDQTPRYLKRMTLNPLVHIPPMAWLFFAVAGMTWGLMPVSPDRFRGRYDDAKVAAAGPGVNLILAIMCVAASVAWLVVKGNFDLNLQRNVAIFLWVGVMFNIAGVLFNLIPIPPLDGAAIVSNFSWRYRQIWETEKGQLAGFLGFALLMSVGAGKVWGTVFAIADWSISTGASLVGQSWSGRPF